MVFLVVVLCVGNVPLLHAQQPLERAQVIEDLRFLLDFLEETHPDPYSAHGGKVEFKRRAQMLVGSVPREGLSAVGIYDLVRPFLGELRDGHTGLTPPSITGGSTSPRYPHYLPVQFGIAMDAVFVAGALPPFDELIGYRVHAVEGTAIEGLRWRAAELFPAENDFGAARSLIWALPSDRYARLLFPDADSGLTLELSGPDGARLDRWLPFRLTRREYRDARWVAKQWDGVVRDRTPFSWQLLKSRNVGYLEVRAMEGREAYEQARASGRQDLEDWVGRYHRRYLNGPAPEDIDEALEAIPCFTTTVHELLTAMKEHDSEYLVVDFRYNGGGWSSLATPFYLLAYGDEYLDYEFPESWTTVVSRNYLAILGTTIEDFNEDWGTSYVVGDYHFEDPESASGPTDLEEYATGLERFQCGLAERVRLLGGNPLYRPETIIVLVSPVTFSAGYIFLYRLWHLGAKIVGVPSAQSGNAFTDATRLQLPNSKLEGWVARSVQMFFPGDWERGRVLMPDFPMRWELFARYEFDRHSEILYALDLIRSGAISGAQRERP